MLNQYTQIIANLPQAASETGNEYHLLTERHIQAVWFEQKYFKNLRTSTNEPIEIISPGIWNAEAGPDFRKAHLKIGGREIQGDIEIHLMDEFWYQHQHHLDDRYNQVVLHVSLWQPQTPGLYLPRGVQLHFRLIWKNI